MKRIDDSRSESSRTGEEKTGVEPDTVALEMVASEWRYDDKIQGAELDHHLRYVSPEAVVPGSSFAVNRATLAEAQGGGEDGDAHEDERGGDDC